MPINRSALKRERQNTERRQRNKVLRTKVRTDFNRLMAAVEAKDKKLTDEALNIFFSDIDKAVKRKVFHINKGSRKKARMMKLINNAFSQKKTAQAS